MQRHNSEQKGKELEPLKMFIAYEKGVAEKLKRVECKYGFKTVFTKTKDLRGKLWTKQKDEMETSGAGYELHRDNCFKKYIGEIERKNERTSRWWRKIAKR